jgi:hypothetical protein
MEVPINSYFPFVRSAYSVVQTLEEDEQTANCVNQNGPGGETSWQIPSRIAAGGIAHVRSVSSRSG